MSSGRKKFCVACGVYRPAHGFTEDFCPTCIAEARDAEDVPVSGRELQELREAHGVTRAELADLLNIAERRTGGDQGGYANNPLDAKEIERFEQSMIHKSFVTRVATMLKGRNGSMSDNNATDLAAKTAAARESYEAYQAADAEVQTLASDLDSALDRLLDLGVRMEGALRERRRLFYAAVAAEKARARAAGEDVSRVDSIQYRAWRRAVRVPAGVITMLEFGGSEYAVINPGETDNALSPARAIEYQANPNNTTDGVPFDAAARRKARARAGA